MTTWPPILPNHFATQWQLMCGQIYKAWQDGTDDQVTSEGVREHSFWGAWVVWMNTLPALISMLLRLSNSRHTPGMASRSVCLSLSLHNLLWVFVDPSGWYRRIIPPPSPPPPVTLLQVLTLKYRPVGCLLVIHHNTWVFFQLPWSILTQSHPQCLHSKWGCTMCFTNIKREWRPVPQPLERGIKICGEIGHNMEYCIDEDDLLLWLHAGVDYASLSSSIDWSRLDTLKQLVGSMCPSSGKLTAILNFQQCPGLL